MIKCIQDQVQVFHVEPQNPRQKTPRQGADMIDVGYSIIRYVVL